MRKIKYTVNICGFLIVCFILAQISAASSVVEIIDLKDPITLTAGEGEFNEGIDFGFSLGVFKNKTHRRLLIGAPKAQTSQDVESPGALYSCDIHQQVHPCSQLKVDTRNSSDKYSSYMTKDLKDNQRLGASLSVNGEHIVVCAPNWHYYDQRGQTVYDSPVGLCFNSSSLDNFHMFSPPFDIKGNENLDYLSTGYCQTGFSISMNKINSPVLGGPGCYGWQGDVWSQDDGEWIRFGQNFTSDQIIPHYRDGSQWSQRHRKAKVYDSYLGYSVAEGVFGGQSGIITGMPRATPVGNNNYHQISGPKVIVYRQEEDWLSVWEILSPPKNPDQLKDTTWLFSYFGYNVAVLDVNHDGLDDIIVGAPFYSNSTHRDMGAILIYLQQNTGNDNKLFLEGLETPEVTPPFRRGYVQDGRFGSAISVVGDIDGDGLKDLAVGAPYGKEGGRIYVFLGSAQGLSMTPNQVIIASAGALLNNPSLVGFGASISNADFTISPGNFARNDIAVGAPSSDKVVLMSSRPSLTVSWSVKFSAKMNMLVKCPFGDGQSFPCVKMITCGSYELLTPKDNITHRFPREFIISHKLDIRFPSSRLRFSNLRGHEKDKVYLKYQTQTCFEKSIYSLQLDNLEPYEVLSEIDYDSGHSDKTLLDFRQVTRMTSLLEIDIKCKTGSISSCISDIRLTTQPKPETVNIEVGHFEIFFDVTNNAETAYHNKLLLTHGTFLEVSGKAAVLKSSTVNLVIECYPTGPDSTVCSLGTFIHRGDKLSFKINFNIMSSLLLPSNLRKHPSYIEVTSTVTSLSNILPSSPTTSTTRTQIKAEPRLDLTKSSSSTEIVHYNSSDYFISPTYDSIQESSNETSYESSQFGEEVIHDYHIYNPSSYAVENIKIEIFWPLNISGSYLLYLEQEPHIPGTLPENCTVVNATGSIMDAMSDLPLVDQIEWYCLTCLRKLIQPKEEILIHIHGIFVHATIKSLGEGTALDRVKSFVKVGAKPIIFGELRLLETENSFETNIAYDKAKPHTKITYWVYIVSIIIACILIALIVFILYKCNFFSRMKPVVDNEIELENTNHVEDEQGEDENTQE